MKPLVCAFLLLAATLAADENRITVDTTNWPSGRAQMIMVDDTVRVTVVRIGDARHVTIERLGLINKYTLEPVDGELQVTSSDTGKGLILSPHRLVIDGVSLEKLPRLPKSPGSMKPRYYICPKDQTMLRVPHDKHDGEFTCPVDGTKMKPAVGRESAYFLLQ